ncbi:MAG: zinc-binding dehydrogenase [Pseudomonadota bacterium]
MTIPPAMFGVQLVAHGGPEALVWNDAIPTPMPGPGEVLTRVLAAGVNNTDVNTRIGWYNAEVTGATDEGGAEEAGGWSGALNFPLIQGGDLCGEVVAVGEGVDLIDIGARVTCPLNQAIPTADAPTRFQALGSELDGAFAEYCRIPADQVFTVDASPLSDVEIAAMPGAYGTAINLVTRSGVKAGERVLATGASGGVGLAAVQLATYRGANVTAVTSPAKADAVREAGAQAIIWRDEAPAAAAFDAVIDIVGGPAFGGLLTALKPGGRYAVSGAIAGPIVEADLRIIYLNDITIFGCTYTPKEVFADLVEIMRTGAIRPVIAATYLLRDIAEAQAEFMKKTAAGKIVLIPGARD